MADGINNNTKLMLHVNGNLTDSSSSNKAVSSSGSPILTANFPFVPIAPNNI